MTVTINGASLSTLCISSASVTARTADVSECSLTQESTGSRLTASFSKGDGVVITAGGTVIFTGKVTETPTAIDRGWRITAKNAQYDLDRCPLIRSVASVGSDGQVTTIKIGKIRLGQGTLNDITDTSLLATGQAISDVVSFASSAGAGVSVGTIETGVSAPPSEHDSITAGDAIRVLTRWTPNMVPYERNGAYNLRSVEALPTVSLNVQSDGLQKESIAFQNREDLLPSGVTITWKRIDSYDGQSVVHYASDTAGNQAGFPPPLPVTLQLAGAVTTTNSQQVVTRTIPTDITTEAAKDFYIANLPWLETVVTDDLRVAYQSVTMAPDNVNPDDSSGDDSSPPYAQPDASPADYPRQLVGAGLPDWLRRRKKAAPLRLKAWLFYRGHDKDIRKRFPLRATRLEDGSVKEGGGYPALLVDEVITGTDATTRTEKEVDEFTAGQEPIAGLAAAWWSQINHSRYEGGFTADLTANTAQCLPGNKVIVTDYAPVATPVREASFDLIARTVSVSCGWPGQLSITDLAELMRGPLKTPARWESQQEREEGYAEAGKVFSGQMMLGRDRFSPAPGDSASDSEPWSLDVVSETAFTVNVGVVKDGFNFDHSARMTIIDYDEEFEASAGDFLALTASHDNDLAPHILTDFTLELVSDWDSFPLPWKFQSSGGVHQLRRVVWPLYFMVGSASVGSYEEARLTQLTDDVSAYRIVGNNDLLLDWRVVAASDTNDRILSPILSPGDGALPIAIT